MKNLIKYLAVLIALWCVDMKAQTLDALLTEADSSNLELKALYQEYLADLQKAPQVSQLPDPEVGLGVFPLPVETRLGPQWVRLSATQMFPWKGTLNARKEVALSMATSEYERIASARLEVRYQIRQAYYQLYRLEKRQAILMQSIDIFRILESVAITRVEAGKANLADVLRIQIRIRELEEELNILENQKSRYVAPVNQLLNRTAETPVMVFDSLGMAALSFDLDSLLSVIREGHPALRMYTRMQETSQKAIQLNALEEKPSFAVGIDYINVGNRTDADPLHNGRDILSPRVGVRIPLYRDKYRAKEEEEKLKIASLDTRKDEMLLKFRSAIEKAGAEMKDGRIKYDLYAEQKSTTQSVVDLLLTEYSNEGAGFIDLLQTENQLVQYDLMMLDAIVSSKMAEAEIERYIP